MRRQGAEQQWEGQNTPTILDLHWSLDLRPLKLDPQLLGSSDPGVVPAPLTKLTGNTSKIEYSRILIVNR